MNNKKIILATAGFCEPCKAIKKEIALRGIDVEIKDADDDKQFFLDNGVRSVPTLLIFDGELLKERLIGLPNIIGYFNT